MSTKRMSAALLALVLTTMASPAQSGPHRSSTAQSGPHRSSPAPSARGYQGEAPPWSFACIKDSGPTDCREPMWIYRN
jgi:hypothetical protein